MNRSPSRMQWQRRHTRPTGTVRIWARIAVVKYDPQASTARGGSGGAAVDRGKCMYTYLLADSKKLITKNYQLSTFSAL